MQITTQEEYEQALARLASLMAKGSVNVSRTELTEMLTLDRAIQAYELSQYPADEPAASSDEDTQEI